jgi:hypothetical protein
MRQERVQEIATATKTFNVRYLLAITSLFQMANKAYICPWIREPLRIHLSLKETQRMNTHAVILQVIIPIIGYLTSLWARRDSEFH